MPPVPLRIIDGEVFEDSAAVYRSGVLDVYREVVSGVGNRPDAEDLTEEVFERFLQGLRTPVCTSTALVGLRHETRSVVSEHWWRAYGVVVRAELDVTRMSSLLPWAERLLRLRFTRLLTIKETAAAMDLSVATVQLFQYQALLGLAARTVGRPPSPRSLRRVSSFVDSCVADRRPQRWQLSTDDNAAVQAAVALSARSAALQLPRRCFVDRLGGRVHDIGEAQGCAPGLEVRRG